MLKPLCVSVLLLAAGACGTTTSPAPTPTTFSLTGQVTDGTAGTGISGATVSIADGSNAGKSATTDSSGNYSLTVLQPGGFTVNVTANGYVSLSKGVTLTANQTVSFPLTRVPAPPSTFTVGGTVTDGTSGGVLPNINIQATDSVGNVKSTLTGSSGAYSIGGLAAGSVTLTVSAISYQTAQLTVAVTSDTHLDIVLQRTVCTFTISATTLSFRSTGGTGAVTVASQATGCAWTARSNDAFITITSGNSGNDTGMLTFSVTPNTGSSRSGTLTIAGLTVTVTQDAAAPMVTAVYDLTFKAPFCNDVGRGCTSGMMLNGSGSTEANQPNTIFSSCPDGAGNGHFATINSIQVSTLDGSALASGTAVRIDVSGGGSTADQIRVYVAADALRPAWIQVAAAPFGFGVFSVQTILPSGTSLQAIRVNYAFGGSFGPGPCATGSDDDNDDLVFRVQ